MATGADADRIVDEARRRTVSRRELARAEGFEQLSPEVGELDEAAVSDALATDPDATLALLARMTGATDTRLRALAERLAARLFLDLARQHEVDGRGIGRIVSAPYRPDEGDIDIDRSIEELVSAGAERRAVMPGELVIRSWGRPSTAICLLVDRSGSMHGRPLATSALAAAVVAARTPDAYAVLSFARDVVAARAMWETRPTDEVIDRVLSLRGHGTTDVALALRAAGAQLATASAARRVTVLLSDCRATEHGDVVGAARSLDELVVLAPDGDSAEAAALAESAGGRWTTVSGPSDVVAALSSVLNR